LKKTPNSQHLKGFKEIEKSLWSFFRLFGNLCEQCANQTLKQAEGNFREKKNLWCCCLIDNQIDCNWEALNKIQSRTDSSWYEKVKKSSAEYRNLRKIKRMPGNGPCPALSAKGCLLKQYRPITCTTQLCGKMIFVLGKLQIIPMQKRAPLQIEDIITVPGNILQIMYVCKNSKKVDKQEIADYVSSVNVLRAKFAKTDAGLRQKAINQSMLLMEGR